MPLLMESRPSDEPTIERRPIDALNPVFGRAWTMDILILSLVSSCLALSSTSLFDDIRSSCLERSR